MVLRLFVEQSESVQRLICSVGGRMSPRDRSIWTVSSLTFAPHTEQGSIVSSVMASESRRTSGLWSRFAMR